MIAGFEGHLLPEDYVERLIDEPGRRAAGETIQRQLKGWLNANRFAGPASGLRALVDAGAIPLVEILGLIPAGPIVVYEDYAIVRCRAVDHDLPLVVTSWGASLNRFWREAVVEGARRGSMWALLFNGTHVRVVRPGRLHSRRHLEVQLDAAADDVRTAATLGLVFRCDSLGGEAGGRGALASTVADAERHAAGVCRSLKAGVLDASTHLLQALVSRDAPRSVNDVFEQSLTIVYRLLFLFFAEARALVPLWHPLYRDSYSVESLRKAAMLREHAGLWDGLRAVTRLAHAGVEIGGLKVTAFNGRLFAPSRTPLAERRGLDNRAAAEAIVAVSTRASPDGEGRQPISYRDLGVEQLGAVYETLLDYTPHVERPVRGRTPLVTLKPGSGVRKSTGTFYTPQALVDYLVRDCLAPLVRDATPEQILERRVLDPSMGSGAFLVGACRFLGDAYEAALVAHGRCLAVDIGPRERASIRRLVAERCLFGVDINPTAVQLARLSLWLTTLAADRPLTFLDHHLRVGDSLAGAWLSTLRTAPARKRAAGPLPLFPDSVAHDALRAVLPVRFRLSLDPTDTASQVRAKERALTSLSAPGSPLWRWTGVADAWCAAWLGDPPVPAAAFAALSDALLGRNGSLAEATERALLSRVEATSAAKRLFHWELEFPEVFFGSDGLRRSDAGFDAVVGNPPWDMVRADTEERRPQTRNESIALVRFARDSGVYDTRTDGHVNRYQLFVERAMALARPGGRIGLVLPSGMLTDSGSAPLRRSLFSRCAVERLVGFDNRSATFPIHRSVKFVLLSAQSGGRTGEIACRFGETDPAALEGAADSDGRPSPVWFSTRLTPTLLAHLSGADLSVPDLRSGLDLAIAERAASLFAPAGSHDGWNVHFGRELNATEDRRYLLENGRGVPVLEGKLIEPFRTDPGRARWHVSEAEADRLLGTRWRRARLAYRDVSSPSNRVTLIAAMLGAGTVSTHTLFCLKDPLSRFRQHLLLACFNSLVVNFLVRLRVNTHVTTGIVERLPLPREDQMGPAAGELALICGVLAKAHDTRAYVRLNALVAQMYRLTEEEFAHVLGTFPLIDRSERDAMLREFV